MKKEIWLLAILCFFIGVGQAGAAIGMGSYFYNPNDIAKATGTVISTGFNTIEIFDEEQKRAEEFIYLQQAEQFRKGDYIRLYYHPRGAIVVMVKRMTVLEYKKDGQNLGKIYQAN